MTFRILRYLGLVLCLLSLAAAAVELVLGGWLAPDPLAGIPVPRDRDQIVFPIGLYDGAREFTLTRDHWGLRDGADPARLSILAVGGGRTSQTDLARDHTWQAVLERAFEKDGQKVSIGNAGQDGWGIDRQVWALETWLHRIPGLRPRFIIVTLDCDDLTQSGVQTSAPLDGVRRQMRTRIVQNSYFLRVWRSLTGPERLTATRQERVRPDDDAAVWTDQDPAPALSSLAFSEYRQALHRMADAIHDLGAVPVFLTQAGGDYRIVDGKVLGLVRPDGGSGVAHYRWLAAVNQATREECRTGGWLCLDPAREVAFAPGDFIDDRHFSPKGAEKIGLWLHAKLAALAGLPENR